MYTCIYMYIYVYMYICIYVYMYICIYVHMYICIYVCMHICMCVYTYTYIYIYVAQQRRVGSGGGANLSGLSVLVRAVRVLAATRSRVPVCRLALLAASFVASSPSLREPPLSKPFDDFAQRLNLERQQRASKEHLSRMHP